MPVHNADIAEIFTEIADLLEIQDANPFRIRAYRNAARIVSEYPRDLRAIVQKGEPLKGIPGIGEDLASKIVEIVSSGSCGLLQRLHKELPPAITELLHIPGLGPRRVKALYHNLEILTLDQLYAAAREGRIRALPGFGNKTEQNILHAVEAHVSKHSRFKLATAAQYAESLAAYLRAQPQAGKVTIAGSFRRMKDTVGDLDIVTTSSAPGILMQHFIDYEDIAEILSSGPTRASVRLKSGLQIDLRIVPDASYGAALHYFTGSKSHNIAIRRMAQKLGLKINEYGVFSGKQRIAGETEKSVYRAVGLPYIPPELREMQGEIEAARMSRLPDLVELTDIRGDLHAHTKATDGHNSLIEMAETAQKLGYEYLAITEHSRRLTVAHGLDPTRLLRQCDEIDALNEGLSGITLLKGIEVDILEDGRLDLPDDVLARLDLVVGAVHSKFDLPRAKQTDRILRAMARPHFTLLAHPTGRLLEQREAYDVDMPRIIREAFQRGCFLELNAHPERLDLIDTYCRMAKDEGVLISINSDAHSTYDLANIRYGIGQARRGWLEKRNVLNTRGLHELRALIRPTI